MEPTQLPSWWDPEVMREIFLRYSTVPNIEAGAELIRQHADYLLSDDAVQMFLLAVQNARDGNDLSMANDFARRLRFLMKARVLGIDEAQASEQQIVDELEQLLPRVFQVLQAELSNYVNTHRHRLLTLEAIEGGRRMLRAASRLGTFPPRFLGEMALRVQFLADAKAHSIAYAWECYRQHIQDRQVDFQQMQTDVEIDINNLFR